jgi:adenylylsulfate kinase
MNNNKKHVFLQDYKVNKALREDLLNQKGKLIWFTGLSGSGKSTIANLLEQKLFELGFKTYLLDGDNVRLGLNSDLGFSDEDRKENIRRVREISALMLDAGLIVITAFVSPFRGDRDKIRKMLKKGDFIEVYVNCSLEECESRDVKGLYKKARSGEISDFTGINSVYEVPLTPEIELKTDVLRLDECINKVLTLLLKKLKPKNDPL